MLSVERVNKSVESSNVPQIINCAIISSSFYSQNLYTNSNYSEHGIYVSPYQEKEDFARNTILQKTQSNSENSAHYITTFMNFLKK